MTTDYAELARECRKHAEFLDGIIGIPVTYEATFPQQAFRNAVTALDHLSAENAKLKQALQRVKDHCAGDALPRWNHGVSTTNSRGFIMDVCDAALQQGDKK